MIKSFKGMRPDINASAFVDESARIIGDVKIGPESSVWFNATVRGDVNYIRIGARTNVQDGSVLHVTRYTHPLVLGDDITVGHCVTLHGCHIEGPALIGIGAIVLDGAHIESNVVVAAGALVTEGMLVKSGTLLMGAPAKPKRALTDKEALWLKESALNYVEYRLDYMDGPATAPDFSA
ncbi:MAG TPA: gamma carbonic anhydrase family protein [Nitrospirae bacterium]|nr:gamma carbonic anhydrase family protein [Nitrospirota bacterium]